MVTLNNQTTDNLGPYNGISIQANSSVTISGAVAPYISDGKLLSDIIAEKITVTFASIESKGAAAAALLMQLGSLFNTDSDGANLSRVKQAPAGWTYQLRMIELITASLNGLFNSDPDLKPLNDAIVTCYDSNGVVISDASSLGECVKTVMDLEPLFDYYIIGGKVKMTTSPSDDVRVSVIGVPDVPASMGGSKIFVQNVNFKFIGTTDEIDADGRASKALLYDSKFHTNKIRFIVNHPSGANLVMGFFLELYKQ